MSELIPVFLLAVAGFLAGGAYTAWKTARVFAVVLAVIAVVALAGGVAWLM